MSQKMCLTKYFAKMCVARNKLTACRTKYVAIMHDNLQVCWGSYDTLTGHGLKFQKIKKGMALKMKLDLGYFRLNLFILSQPILTLGSSRFFNSVNTTPIQVPNTATSLS